MTYLKPSFRHPNAEKNAIGFYKHDYEGRLSTLCAGCGHDSINASIVQACFDIALEPHRSRLPTSWHSRMVLTPFMGVCHQ